MKGVTITLTIVLSGTFCSDPERTAVIPQLEAPALTVLASRPTTVMVATAARIKSKPDE